ncbi:MAG: hypothetical protein GTN82_01145 [Candidatus Aminicenantes bacterium]|nr:hypothetical protein [Candidatus Aminicenantes bacterium]
MIKKVLKVIMIVIMLLGIAFSISNFVSVKTEAGTKDGAIYEWPDGTTDCIDIGNECKKGGPVSIY